MDGEERQEETQTTRDKQGNPEAVATSEQQILEQTHTKVALLIIKDKVRNNAGQEVDANEYYHTVELYIPTELKLAVQMLVKMVTGMLKGF